MQSCKQSEHALPNPSKHQALTLKGMIEASHEEGDQAGIKGRMALPLAEGDDNIVQFLRVLQGFLLTFPYRVRTAGVPGTSCDPTRKYGQKE